MNLRQNCPAGSGAESMLADRPSPGLGGSLCSSPVRISLVAVQFGVFTSEHQQNSVQFSSVLSHVRLFPTPWTVARQASLSITNSQSLLKLMSIESVMPSNHLILCHPLLLLPSIFPSISIFPVSQLFTSGGQSIAVSTSESVLPMNIQD